MTETEANEIVLWLHFGRFGWSAHVLLSWLWENGCGCSQHAACLSRLQHLGEAIGLTFKGVEFLSLFEAFWHLARYELLIWTKPRLAISVFAYNEGPNVHAKRWKVPLV
jgi:hypothetical protein